MSIFVPYHPLETLRISAMQHDRLDLFNSCPGIVFEAPPHALRVPSRGQSSLGWRRDRGRTRGDGMKGNGECRAPATLRADRKGKHRAGQETRGKREEVNSERRDNRERGGRDGSPGKRRTRSRATAQLRQPCLPPWLGSDWVGVVGWAGPWLGGVGMGLDLPLTWQRHRVRGWAGPPGGGRP